MAMLLIAGIGAILAGLVAIGFGIPVKEFGFGNTLILTGTIGVCTGLVLLGLSAIVRQLRGIAQQLLSDGVSVRHNFPPELSGAEQADPLRKQPAARADRSRPAKPVEGSDATDDSASETNEEASAEPPSEARQRRNLLFATSSRRERERPARTADAAADAAKSEAPASVLSEGSLTTYVDTEAWPRTESSPRPARNALLERAPVADKPAASSRPPAPAEAVAEKPAAPVPPPPAAPKVTVIKSGVVDGMAYSLYSDGSIEAQLPEGTMRFASIDDLRDHLDNRG